MPNMIQQIFLKSFVEKTARKNIKYWRNRTIFKVGHLENPMQRPLQNSRFGSTIKIHKNMPNMIQQIF